MAKLPAFQFYPGDWLKDPSLSVCSAGARGVWMDMLCLMFESETRGVLQTNGEPWTIKQIAKAIRGEVPKNVRFITELVQKNVIFCAENGAFCSKRMMRDEAERRRNRESKRKKRDLGESCPGFVPANSRPSSSSSSSSASAKESLSTNSKAEPKPKSDPWELAIEAMTGDALNTDTFKTAWLDWVADRKERKKPMTSRAVKMQIKKLEKIGNERAIAAIEISIANGWQGITEPRTSQTTGQGPAGSGQPKRQRKTAADRGEYEEPSKPIPFLR